MDFISPWIHTTEKCNMKCHYCYVKGNRTIKKETYQQIEKFLMSVDTDKRHLRFAGGEPLLVFDLWRGFAESMLRKKGTWVEVLTNLYDVPVGFFKFAEKDNVNVSVSIDSGKIDKKLNKDISEKLKKLKNPWIMTVVTKENINELDLLAAFVGMNKYGWAISTDYFDNSEPWIEKLHEKLMKSMLLLKEFNYNFSHISFNNCSINSGFSGCRAGNEMITIDCDGDIYRCQTQIGNKSKIIGNIHSGYKKIEKKSSPHCKKCSANLYCNGWCPLYHKPSSSICDVIKIFELFILKEAKNA